MTADLERRLRALRDDLPEPPAGIDLSAVVTVEADVPSTEPVAPSTDPVIVAEPVSLPARRRRRTRWLVAATVAAALVVGVAVAAGIVRSGHEDPAPVAVTPFSTARIDPATQVVRDGDRVEGTGNVVAVDGQPVRFCAPAAVALPGVDGPVDPYAACRQYLTVIGLDLAALGERTPFPASGPYPAGVDGRVHLVATLRGATLVDVTASPAPYGSDAIPDGLPEVPCAAPAGGWPTGPADENVDVTAVTDYGTAHPGVVVNVASLRPSPTQVVTYVLTAGDPAPVVAALRPTYGEALCVVRSVYTAAELAAGASAVDPDGPLWKLGDVYSSAPSDFGRDAQPQVTLELEMVTDAVLAAVPDLAPGLLQFRPWLSPAR